MNFKANVTFEASAQTKLGIFPIRKMNVFVGRTIQMHLEDLKYVCSTQVSGFKFFPIRAVKSA